MITFEKYAKEDRALYESLVFDEAVMKMNYGRVFTKEEADFLFRHIVEHNSLHANGGYYKVFSQEHNCYIGYGALAVDDETRTVEVEYMVLPKFWRCGFGTKILLHLLALCRKTGVQKVEAITDPGNGASRRILEKAAFSLEKEYLNDDGDPAVLYGLTL